MHLVDEEDDVPFRFHLVHKPLDAALKLAAELRARHESGEVEQMDLLLLQARRYIPGRNAHGKAFGDGRLANARLADEAGVVLRAAAQDLHHAVQLAFAADHGVDLPGGRLGRQVRAVGVQVAALRLLLEALALLGLLRLPLLLLLLPVLPDVRENVLQERGGEGRRAAGREGARLVRVALVLLPVRVHELAELRFHGIELLVG